MERRNHIKRVFSIALCLMMLAVTLAGCASPQPTASAAPPASSAPVSSAPGDASTPSDNNGEVTLPLVAEKTTLTMWAGAFNASLSSIAKDYNETPFFQELEKRTNVHIEFETSAPGSTDAFNLMIASGSLPDIVIYPTSYQDGLDAGIDDGYYLDLTPYMEQYMPNYNRLRLADADSQKVSETNSGRVAALYQISQSQQPPFMGFMMRKDWLDDLGLQVPETVEEWETVLTAFKNEKNAYAPFAMVGSLGFYSTGFNVAGGFWYDYYMNVDGKLAYGETNDRMKDFLTVMADWYGKGLIDPDFMTKQDAFLIDTAMVTTGQTGAFISYYTMKDMYEAASEDPNMELIAVMPPVKNKGDQIHLSYKPDRLSGSVTAAISAKSQNKELAMQWLDYFFTEEGALLANYGVENETFTFDADGKPAYMDIMTANPDGLSLAQTMTYYTMPPSMIPSYYDWTRELGGVSQGGIDMMYVWDKATKDYMIPGGASMTSEENQEYASIFTNITTYSREKITQFITGIGDINTEWDGFVSTINDLGIERCIELRQAALDRYLNR